MAECHKAVAANQRVLITTLTKRMAEDLTEYMTEAGLKVRYIHSDVDTLERIEIIRDLRLGVFDILVGINLLREGLDIPECALVAILDADKEGYLRSKTSLVQTIDARRETLMAGSALCRPNDRILGIRHRGDHRRRARQEEYNQAHGITPNRSRNRSATY